MSFFDALRFRLRAIARPGEHARELAEEMRHHLDLDTQQIAHEARDPVAEHDAPYAARRRFGNATYYE